MQFDWITALAPFLIAVAVLMGVAAVVSPWARDFMLLIDEPRPQDDATPEHWGWDATEVDGVWR